MWCPDIGQQQAELTQLPEDKTSVVIAKEEMIGSRGEYLTFYHVMLCVSAVFAVARCLSVGPSVCLSVCTLVHCIHTAEDILKVLSPSGSTITLVFWFPAPIPNSKGNPFNGGAKYMGVQKIAIFDWNCHLSRKRYKIGPWLLWNVHRKS